MESDNDVCEVCEDYGRLVVCDGCEGAWHRDCHPIVISDQEMAAKTWICHWCRGGDPDLELTECGHLPGCLGQDTPNRLTPICIGPTISGKPCGNNASKQGCVWEEKGVKYCWCSDHWRDQCVELGYDSSLSDCANRIAAQKGFNMRQLMATNQFNIKGRLGLPMTYGDEYLSTNHVSDDRQKEARLAKKARQGRVDRIRIDTLTRSEQLSNAIRLASTRSNLGYSVEISDSDDISDPDFSDDESDDVVIRGRKRPREEESDEVIILSDDESDDVVIQDRKRPREEESEEEPPKKYRRLRRKGDS